ncbi:patatin-like phospholipase [Apiospora kogelbergensis]|uniref:patatin-like phospholipase n=1 Tax=Apiospora kogelbergensis TaxID=1337665 RepID=UPI00312CF936
MTELLLPGIRLNSPSSHKAQPKGAPASNAICSQSTAVSATESLYKALKSLSSLALLHHDGLSDPEREAQRKLDERKQILMARLQNADTYIQWETAAQELDVLEGNEEWKADTSSGDYQPDLIESRLRDLDTARTNCDLRSMLHLVRTALSRDLGGMGNIDFSTLETIAAVVERSAHPLPGDLETKDLLDAVLFARQSFGRSALLLSGGGTFGMSHIGVLKTLFESKLIPRIISGASAGSIVCSVVCTRTDDEIPELLTSFPYGDLAVFEEEGNEDGLMDHVRRLLTEGNWSDIKHLTRVMQNLLGDMTFQEAYNRTRRICNICVSPASIYELPRLLNYVTAPNVMIWSAVAASCSVPLVFSAAPLLVKNPLTGEHSPWNPTPQMWIDGSVDNDLPMTRLAEMFNVNHFIVSQVNPHVVPFLAKEDAPYPISGSQDYVHSNDEGDWLYTVTQLAKGEALHRMHILAEIGIFPTLVSKLRSILSQKYSGDINILPEMGLLDLPKILKNPTIEFMHRSCLLGERATWPKMSRIRDRCAVELALDRAVHALRARVVFSKSQVDLRRLATGSLVNPFRGSESFHINLNLPATETVTAKDKLRQRHRRSSGSCVQPIPPLRHLEDPYKVTDEDTDVEERLEMALRKPHGKSKPLKLKRYSKSQAFQTGPLTTPHLSSVNEPNAFDFAQPPSPIKADPQASEVEDSPEQTTTLDEASTVFSSHVPSHSTEQETSDPYTSDADIDSRSDDSNPGIDIVRSPSEIASDSDNTFQPEGGVSSREAPTPEDNSAPRSRRDSNSWSGIFDPVDPGAGLWS